MKRCHRYEAEIDVEASNGKPATYKGYGVSTDALSPDAVLDSAEAAVRAEDPGARILESRMRRK